MSADAAISHFSQVISQAAAPAFLLGAVAAFISVLFNFLTRVLDLSHAIKTDVDAKLPGADRNVKLPKLQRRARRLGWAIFWALGSGAVTCLVIIASFAAAFFGVDHETVTGVLFATALGLFTVSLIIFGYQVAQSVIELESN